MIHTVEMYGATCDNCKKAFDPDEGAFWNDEDYMQDRIEEDGWYVTYDGKTYCPDCYRFDDDDGIHLVIKKERQKL